MPKPKKRVTSLKQMDELDLRKLPDSPHQAAIDNIDPDYDEENYENDFYPVDRDGLKDD